MKALEAAEHRAAALEPMWCSQLIVENSTHLEGHRALWRAVAEHALLVGLPTSVLLVNNLQREAARSRSLARPQQRTRLRTLSSSEALPCHDSDCDYPLERGSPCIDRDVSL